MCSGQIDKDFLSISNNTEDLMGSTWRQNLFFWAIDAFIICEWQTKVGHNGLWRGHQ